MSVTEPLHAHLVLSSRFENIEIAERALVDLCDHAGFSGDDCYWLVTALREATANAIRHGNRQDPERSVVIDYRIQDDEVTIRVEDEGEGFDLETIPDPTDPGLFAATERTRYLLHAAVHVPCGVQPLAGWWHGGRNDPAPRARDKEFHR